METVPYCRECRRVLDRRDAFCRYCGKGLVRLPKSLASFRQTMMCVYGPPYSVKLRCTACHKKVVYSGLGAPEQNYFCPKCGSPMETISADY